MSNKYFTIYHESTDLSQKLKDYGTASASLELAVDEYLYVGYEKPFKQFFAELEVKNTNANTLSGEYYDGTTWQPLNTLLDESDGFTKSGFFFFEKPNAWAATSVAVGGGGSTYTTVTENNPSELVGYGIEFSGDDGIGEHSAADLAILFPTTSSNLTALTMVFNEAVSLEVTDLENINYAPATTFQQLIDALNIWWGAQAFGVIDVNESTPFSVSPSVSASDPVNTGLPSSSYTSYWTSGASVAGVTLPKKFYVRLKTDISHSAGAKMQGLAILLSNDLDLQGVRSNIVSKFNSGAAWVLKHEQARKDIIQMLRNKGNRIIKNANVNNPLATEGLRFADVTEFDLLEPEQLRQASLYKVLSMIYLDELSDELDDKWSRQGERYLKEFFSMFNTFYLQIDFDDDGISSAGETTISTSTRLSWL